ncbi:MAG: PAS domain S-box protein [Marinilabiliaceae bacterium]|nr:PAS domain S-box protein [Marinilabiliaceae bacterium]
MDKPPIHSLLLHDISALQVCRDSVLPCVVVCQGEAIPVFNDRFLHWMGYPGVVNRLACPDELLLWYRQQIHPHVINTSGSGDEIRFTNWHSEPLVAEVFVTRLSGLTTNDLSFFVQFHDVTARRQRELVEAELNERLRLVFQSMNEAFALHSIITDEQGVPIDYVYLDVNAAFENLTGFTRDRIIGRRLLDVMPNTESYWIQEFGRVALHGGTAQFVNYARELGRYYEVKAYSPKPSQFAVIFTDVTHRTLSEMALKESEERYRFLTENLLDVIWVYDVHDDVFVYVSPSVKKMRGFTAQEVMAQSLIQSFTPSSMQIVAEVLPVEIEKFKRGVADVFNRELEQYCKDGSTVWIDVNAYLRVNDANGHLEVIGTSRNVTDRHRAEAARREMEQRYRLLTEVTNEGILISMDGLVVDVNPSLVRMMGLANDVDQLVGAPVSLLGIDEQAFDLLSNPSDALRCDLSRGNGNLFPAEISMKQVADAELRYRVFSVIDLSLRLEAEKRLLESEARFRSIFDNAVAGIAFADLSGTLLIINKAYSEMLGYEREQLIGASFYDMTHPDDVAKEQTLIANASFPGHDHFTCEKRYIRRNGEVMWANISASILRDGDGNPCSLVAVIMDITQKHEIEQELQCSNDQLSELNRAKDRFFSIIAHDLRGSLANITSLSELLYADFKTSVDPTDKDIVRNIFDSSLKTLALLENLLAWASSQRYSVAVRHEQLVLSPVVRESVMIIESIAAEKNVHLSFDLDDDIVMHSDRAMISTMVRNLVSNAVKYSYNHSQVTISTRLVDDDQSVLIAVADKGVGMTRQTIDGLFDIDHKCSLHGTAGEEGTGLGLVLCHEFAVKLAGTIKVVSEPGKGSCFNVYLPLNAGGGAPN